MLFPCTVPSFVSSEGLKGLIGFDTMLVSGIREIQMYMYHSSSQNIPTCTRDDLPNMLAPQPHCTKSQDCEWLFSGGKKGLGGVLQVLRCHRDVITMPLNTLPVSTWVAESGRCKTETVYIVACSMQEDTELPVALLYHHIVKSFQAFLPKFSPKL